MINTLENFTKFDLNVVAHGDNNIYQEYDLEDLHKINRVSIFEIYDKYKNDEFIVNMIENMKFFTILCYKEKYNIVKEILNPDGGVYNVYNMNKYNNTYSRDIYNTKYMVCYNYEYPLNFEHNIQKTARFIKNVDIIITNTTLTNKDSCTADYINSLNNLLNIDIHRSYILNLDAQFVNNVYNYYNP